MSAAPKAVGKVVGAAVKIPKKIIKTAVKIPKKVIKTVVKTIAPGSSRRPPTAAIQSGITNAPQNIQMAGPQVKFNFIPGGSNTTFVTPQVQATRQAAGRRRGRGGTVITGVDEKPLVTKARGSLRKSVLGG